MLGVHEHAEATMPDRMPDEGASLETGRHRDDRPEPDQQQERGHHQEPHDPSAPEELERRAEEALRGAAQDPAQEMPPTTPESVPVEEGAPDRQVDHGDEATGDDEER